MTGNATIHQIPLDKIICGKQARERFDESTLAGLSQCMRENGLFDPIQVLRLGDMYSLVIGGRRVRAARRAGWTTIPAIVQQGELTKAETVLRQILENVQREDLNAIEKAKAIASLISETGWTATQVAEKLGITNGTVSRLQALLSLPDEIQKRIEAGELPATAAYELTKVQDGREQAALANQVVSGELTRDKLSGAVRAKARMAGSKAPKATARANADLGCGKSVTVCALGLTLDTFIEVLEELLTRARQARPKGISLATFLKILRDTAHK